MIHNAIKINHTTVGNILMLVLITTSVYVLSAGVGAADEVNVTFEGHFGGPTYATAVSIDYPYVGQEQD